jgi:hypothetical protein
VTKTAHPVYKLLKIVLFSFPYLADSADRKLSHNLALKMEAVRTSETLVYSNETARCYIPEDSKLHNRSRENLKSHNYYI